MQTLKKFALNSQEARKTQLSQYYFNPVLLWLYDAIVYRFVSQFLWGVSPATLRQRYRHAARENHLEIGVGTGYLLDDKQLSFERLTLMDLSKACLHKSSKRLKRFDPINVRHNILKPYTMLSAETGYDSIAINYVLHCVPGDFKRKAIIFKNLQALLTEDGILFGSSVLRTKKTGLFAKLALKLLNATGIFNNREDKSSELEQALRANFDHVEFEEAQSAILFRASNRPLKKLL